MHIPPNRRRSSGAVSGAVAVAIALSLTSLPGSASAAPSRDVPSLLSTPTATASTLTLITGDKVAVTTDADGKQSMNILSGTGSSERFQIMNGRDGDFYVYPEDALPAVASGIVDRELFNVTRLLEDGYGDAKTDELPAIVDFQGTPPAAALKQRSADLPASARTQVMPRLGLAAVDVDKDGAKGFWRSVKPKLGKARGTAVPGSTGVAKLWYDGKAKVSLDKSVPRIGAPEAWAKGFDGKSVKVAVLDTGADLNHADIKSRIAASQSFVSGEAVQDGHGHGTHVASIIAGSGAASAGVYKGVAPGADLVVGKVLANDGSGPFSSILAGMEWAVAQGADVVSMSLGGRDTTPGDDPLTSAVNTLSASSGTLFVIAAGNDGRSGESTLGTPGTADAALTVGAVDGADALADFSSRGPRIGDMAIKPEITAPGVGIVAARGAGTAMGTPVDANYTAASGTSMATPHVSGAAAILKQRHPDWSGQRIKDALTAHSKTSATQTVYQQGYGRVDVAAALDPQLELAGTADFGLVEWQPGTYEKETRKVTLRNTGTTAATLTLAASVKGKDGTPVPDGTVTVSGPQVSDGKVTVPAAGSAEVTVTLDPNALETGQYGGHLTATADSGPSVHTPVGFVMDVEQHDLTVKITDRFGNTPRFVSLTAHGMDNSGWYQTTLQGSDSTTASLPVGRYSIEGVIYTADPDDPKRTYAVDLFALPDVDIADKDQTRTVKGSTATDFTVKITGEKRPLERASWMTQLTRDDGAGGHRGFIADAGLLNGSEGKIGAIPSPAATTGRLRMFNFLTQRQPLAQLSVTRPERIAIPITVPAFAQRFEGTKKLQLADVGTAEDFAALDVKGKAVLISAVDLNAVDDQVRRAAAAGAKAVIVAPAVPGHLGNGQVATDLTVPVVNTGYDSGRSLRSLLAKRKVDIALSGVLESGYTYSTPFAEDGRIPSSLARSADTRDFARVKNTFHSDQVRHLGQETLHAYNPGQESSIRAMQLVNAGTSRDDYVLAGPDLAYRPSLYRGTKNADGTMNRLRGTYDSPGKTYQEHWFAAPMRSTADAQGPCNFCRSDVWTRAVALTRDSDARHYAAGMAGSWAYYRNGDLITDTSTLMVPEKADYRFVQELTRTKEDSPGITLAGKIRTEWNFASAAPTKMAVEGCAEFAPVPTVCEAMPAVQLDYDIQLNALNQVSAKKAYSFTVHAGRAKGWTGSTAMDGAKVSVSYDDGVTWASAKVRRKDSNSFRVELRHPKLKDTNGFVTLRTEAWDSAGNRTVQTIDRAYALK
ncbi:S8 family serine peptidase [Streptomyces sp. NPDC056512]|uniref:S8 family serine peptidase n=1 Tax=Streptomyces sp. NPDC056512 TaxID=3345846 RepID=UPI0036B123B2